MRASSICLLVRQALAFRASDNQRWTILVRNFPHVVAELKFTDVAPKMTLPDVMERADDAALQKADEPFRRVRVGATAHKLTAAVIDGLALHARELLRALDADIVVDGALVSHQERTRRHVVANLAIH